MSDFNSISASQQNCQIVPSTGPYTYPNTYTYWSDYGQKYREALEEIVRALGPEVKCTTNECEGCLYEMAEALHVALVALGRPSEHPHWPPHRKTKR